MLLKANNNWQATQDKEILCQLAIDAASTNDWLQAVKINQKILKILHDDIDALNRLAHAYTCQGLRQKAQKVFKQVLEIDPYNTIAIKNLEKIQKMNGYTNGNGKITSFNLSDVFLFEPGKTKIISLLNLAPPAILATLNCADELTINPKKHSVTITSSDGTYLGALPDDLAYRIITFINGGNKYGAYVKYATTKALTIFLRETYRSQKFINQPSFTENKNLYLDSKD